MDERTTLIRQADAIRANLRGSQLEAEHYVKVRFSGYGWDDLVNRSLDWLYKSPCPGPNRFEKALPTKWLFGGFLL